MNTPISNRNVFAVSLLVGILLSGCNPLGTKYERYQSADSGIGIDMDKVAGWLVSESRGSSNSYSQLVFSEPPRKDKRFKAVIVITVTDIARARLDYSDLQDAVSDLQLRRRQLYDGKLLRQTRRMVLENTAAVLEFSYRVPERVHGQFSALIPARETALLFMRNGKLYKVRYVNYDVDYGDFAGPFEHILESMRFQRNS